jgi:hypothetical protein
MNNSHIVGYKFLLGMLEALTEEKKHKEEGGKKEEVLFLFGCQYKKPKPKMRHGQK